MYPQISFPDLKYQLKLFDVVVDIVYFQVIGDNMKNYSSIARKDKSVFISVNFRGSECWVTACHHHGVVSDDEDAQPLAQVSHHLVLVLPQVSGQLPHQYRRYLCLCRRR